MIRDPDNFQALFDMVSKFVSEKLVPYEKEVDESDQIDSSVIDEMRDLGLFGLTIPEQHGGLGLTVEEECRLLFEIGKAAPAFHSMFGTNNGIGAEGIVILGTDEQKSRYLPAMAEGKIIGSFAMTEEGAGSDISAIKTTAVKTNGGWILQGSKRYITNAPIADIITVLVRATPECTGSRGLTLFLVDADTKGLSLGSPESKMGHRGSPVGDVIFNNCFVPDNQLLGEVDEGYSFALSIVTRGRLRVAALCVGIAQRLIADGTHYAKDRQQFGRSISDFQLVQAKLANCETDCYAGQAMVIETAKQADAGFDAKRHSACAKYFCSEMVGRVADDILQIHGGAGYITGYSVERLYRDVRLFRLYEGTSEIQQLVIARDMLKNV